jgi:uroporphyrinogen-III synthase
MTPLFTLVALPWSAPDPAGFDAVMMTSANAARLGGAALERFTQHRLYAVGKATEAAARVVGFEDIRTGGGDGAALLAMAAEQEVRSLLHLAGREHIPLERHGVMIERRIVYGSDPVAALPEPARAALDAGAIALLHSPRAAALFATLVDAADVPRERVRIAAISAAALAAAGQGWERAGAAHSPDDTALLAVAARLCD